MQIKKRFKYIHITIMTVGVILAAFVTPPYFLNNSGTSATQVFNDNQQVNDADYTNQLDYIRSDVAKLDGVTNTIESIKLASSFFSSTTAAIVTKMDNSTLLYTWGKNDYGQLGLGDITSRFIPTLVPSFGSSPIDQIALGSGYSAALLKDDSLYTWGDNSSGQLGLGDSGSATNRPTPTEVKALSGLLIDQITLGGNHSAAVLENGSLYTWGSNSSGQLGLGDSGSATNRPTPTLVPSFSPSLIKQIALGGYHSAVSLLDGSLYTWGSNSSGQLGLGGGTDKPTPTPVPFFSSLQIDKIAFGYEHSAAVLENGSLYTWGYNSDGELGLGYTTDDAIPAPTLVPSFSPSLIKQIALGGYHSAVSLLDGSLYTWGDNPSGQLGLDDEEKRSTPTEVTALSGLSFTQIALGASHSAALLNDGSLYTWGSNSSGQLGLGDSGSATNRPTPTRMPYLGKNSDITANDKITPKQAVDSFWVDGIFDPEGFKNSFNLINIPDVADQEITMGAEPTYNNNAGTVTMKVKFKYYYDKDGLAVADTSTDDMTIGGFNLDTRTTNITVLSEPRADLTPTNFKEQLEKDGAVVAGDQYTLSVTNITFLEQFLKIEDVPVGTIYTLNINPNQTDDATGVLSFKLSLNQYFSDGTLKIEPYDKIFNLNLLSAPIPTPVESNTFPWWWILVGIGGAAIIGLIIWLLIKKNKQKEWQLVVKQMQQQKSDAKTK